MFLDIFLIPFFFVLKNTWFLSVLGDPRVNQNPALLSFGIVFYRWHNLQAAILASQHPEWDDEDLFQGARRRVIATLQVIDKEFDSADVAAVISLLFQTIIMYEYLPSLLGDTVPPYTGYKPDVYPGISHVFQGAAFRYDSALINVTMLAIRVEEICFLRPSRGGLLA